MDFRSLVIPIRIKEGFTMVFEDRIPVRALRSYVRLFGHNLCDPRYGSIYRRMSLTIAETISANPKIPNNIAMRKASKAIEIITIPNVTAINN